MARTSSSRAASRSGGSRASGKATSKPTSKPSTKSSRTQTSSKGGKTSSTAHSHETKARKSLQRNLARDFPDMSEKSRNKLENSFINKVNRTKQSDWYKARRAGQTKEDWFAKEVRNCEKEYAGRRHNEDAIVSKYQNYCRSNPSKKFVVKDSNGEKITIKTDATGEIYQVNNYLLPNKTVQVGGYKYKTDEFGRTTVASGKLQDKNHKGRRDIDLKIDKIGKGDQKNTDNRGHLIADQFEGLPELINLVPQDSTLNSGDYKKLEQDLENYKREGHEVTLRVDVKYDENDVSYRPIGFYMTYSIDGDYSDRYFKNQANQED